MNRTKRVRAPQSRRAIVRSTPKAALKAKLSVVPPIYARRRTKPNSLEVLPSNLLPRITFSGILQAVLGQICWLQPKLRVYWAGIELAVFHSAHPNHTAQHIHQSLENPSRYRLR